MTFPTPMLTTETTTGVTAGKSVSESRPATHQHLRPPNQHFLEVLHTENRRQRFTAAGSGRDLSAKSTVLVALVGVT